jgi:hypothetical protein
LTCIVPPQAARRTVQAKPGAPGAIRTHDLRFRKPLLYPTELRAHAAAVSFKTKWGASSRTGVPQNLGIEFSCGVLLGRLLAAPLPQRRKAVHFYAHRELLAMIGPFAGDECIDGLLVLLLGPLLQERLVIPAVPPLGDALDLRL